MKPTPAKRPEKRYAIGSYRKPRKRPRPLPAMTRGERAVLRAVKGQRDSRYPRPQPVYAKRLLARLKAAERLVGKWKAEASWLCGTERREAIDCLRRCASELKAALKENP